MIPVMGIEIVQAMKAEFSMKSGGKGVYPHAKSKNTISHNGNLDGTSTGQQSGWRKPLFVYSTKIRNMRSHPQMNVQVAKIY